MTEGRQRAKKSFVEIFLKKFLTFSFGLPTTDRIIKIFSIMEYKIGQSYSLSYVGKILGNDGNPYLVVTDNEHDFTVKPYDFQVEYNDIPSKLDCFVNRINDYDGLPRFSLDKKSILKDRYLVMGESYDFTVTNVCLDKSTNCPFYELSDAFGITHRFYPSNGAALKKENDIISLVVCGIKDADTEKNNARLKLMDPEEMKAKAAAAEAAAQASAKFPKFPGLKYFGVEDETTEFKSSIVFPAGKHEADIDEQLGVIARTVAGFMNKKGGILYVGVADNGYTCGIEADFPHLNDGTEDYPGIVYKENEDNYILKIVNRLRKHLGVYATTLVDVTIESDEGTKYCVIKARPASRPVLFDQKKIFVRTANLTQLLTGDAIVQFIIDRVTKSEYEALKAAESVPVAVTPSEEVLAAPVIPVKVTPVPAASTLAASASAPAPAWRHIAFYDNGDWSFHKNVPYAPDIIRTVAIPSDAKRDSLILMVCYENGHADAVDLKRALYGRHGLLPMDKRRRDGICSRNGRIVNAFIVTKRDMVLFESEIAGKRYVKVHDVAAIGAHQTMGNQGNTVINELGATLVNAYPIKDDAGSRVAVMGMGIFIKKTQMYYKVGVEKGLLSTLNQQTLDELEAAI